MADNNIIRIILEALDKNTGPVIQGATQNVTKLGTATKLTADQEKKLAGEFDTLLKRIDPAYAAQAKFTAGVSILEQGLKAQLITQQQAAHGYRLLQAEMEATGRAANGAGAEIAVLGRSLAPAAIAAAVLGIGQSSIKAAEEAEQSVGRVDAALKATRNAAGLTGDELDNLAQSMAKATRFNDEEIRNGISVMLTFRQVSGDSFDRAIKLAADWAQLMNTDFRSAARQLGSALDDPIHGLDSLSEAGVRFTESQKAVIKEMIETGNHAGAINIVLTELEGRVGGTAERLNTGLTKSTSEASKAWRELTEAIGEIKAVEGSTNAVFSSWTTYLKDMKRVIESGDWLDRLAFFSVGLTTPSMLEENQVSGSVGGREERLAREAKLQEEINHLLDTRAQLQKKISDETGKVRIKDLGTERDLIKDQITQYKSLRQAMVQAFQDAGKEAEAARERAQGFLDRAASTREGSKQKIQDREILQADRSSPEEGDALRVEAIQDALLKAQLQKLDAQRQRNEGNLELADQSLEKADEQIARAERLADSLHDEEEARRRILEVGEASASNDEERAAIEKKKEAEASARQEALGKQITDNAERLAKLEESLASVESRIDKLTQQKNTVSLEADEAAFQKLNAQIDELLRKKAALASRDPNFTGVFDSKGNAVYRDPPSGGSSGNFAYGGEIPGNSPHDRADDVWIKSTSGEWMMQRPSVRYYGRDFMRAINEMRLPRFGGGYAYGGEIGASRSVINRVSMPALSSVQAGRAMDRSLDRGTFVLSDGTRFEASASPDVFDRLTSLSLQYRKRR